MAARDLYVFNEWIQGGAYKIGSTQAGGVKKRLAQVQTGNAWELRQVVLGRGLGWMERTLHRAFHDERMRGEWFASDGAVEVFVDHLADTCASHPRTAAEVFEAVASALRTKHDEKAARKAREWWKDTWYREAAERYEAMSVTYRGLASAMRSEAKLRFTPDADLPSFAEALNRKNR